MKMNRIWLLAVAVLVGMVVLNTTPAVAAQHEQVLKVGKKGGFTFVTETMVGDMMLKPGRYIIQHRVEGEDHFVSFKTSEGKKLGEFKCKLEPLSKKVEDTTLYINSEGGMNRLTKVKIAGETCHVL